MDVKNMFIWYQQKIGTYDKQKWETNIEQCEQSIYGLTHIQTRSTKPNTNLIDLDLVRGSSFTKAKPQHGFFKVVKLATMRCIFYPFYGKWWIEQTTVHIFLTSLIVYISLILNVIIHFKYLPVINTNWENLRSSPSMEIFVPLIMMWILSLIHSQIVATSPVIESKNVDINRRQYKRNSNNIKRSNKTLQNVCTSKISLKKEDVISEQSSSSFIGKSNITPTRFQGTSLQIKNEENQLSNKRSLHKLRKRNSHVTSDLHSVIENKERSLNNGIHKSTVCSSDSESEIETSNKIRKKTTLINKRHKYSPVINIFSPVDSQCDSEDELIFTPDNIASASEWMGVTTNSEDCSYSSDIDNISESNVEPEDCTILDSDLAPTAILNPPCLKVSCIIWERNEIKKADLSVLDISSAIIGKVDSMPECMDYFYFGIIVATILAFLPMACRLLNMLSDNTSEVDTIKKLYHNITLLIETSFEKDFTVETYRTIALQVVQLPEPILGCIYHILYANTWDFIAVVIASLQRWILASIFFFLLCVAERTFKQRLLYAKLFSHLTSLRRAKKSDLPHFRLNKVRNIKTWLSVRSYLKKRGPQRSVDVIVSTAFVVNLLLLIYLCVELLKDTVIFSQYYLEALIWCLGLGTLLLRFMTLGTKINRKYRNLSVLITEQINLYLQIEQKPHKKDEFTVANNVLKLAIDLLKELENPFKIYGLSANPILYNVTKLVILSALSGVLSEMLGFKLKLHKIKIK